MSISVSTLKRCRRPRRRSLTRGWLTRSSFASGACFRRRARTALLISIQRCSRRTKGGHRVPVGRIETLLDAPELEARVPPRISGEGAQGGQGAAEPRDGLVRQASQYTSSCMCWSNDAGSPWVVASRGNEVEESET